MLSRDDQGLLSGYPPFPGDRVWFQRTDAQILGKIYAGYCSPYLVASEAAVIVSAIQRGRTEAAPSHPLHDLRSQSV